MIRRLATVAMFMPAIVAAALAFSAEPQPAVPVDQVRALEPAEIAALLEMAGEQSTVSAEAESSLPADDSAVSQ